MPTKDEVRQAMDDLEAQGLPKVPKAIRDQIGYGSYRDITRYQKEILSEAPRPRRQPPAPSRPANGTHAISDAPPPQPAPEPAVHRGAVPPSGPTPEPTKAERIQALLRERDDYDVRYQELLVERCTTKAEADRHNREILYVLAERDRCNRDAGQLTSELSWGR